MEIKNKINDKNDGEVTKIEILSGKKIDLNELDLIFKNDLSINVSWNSELKFGEKIPFTFSFFDENKNLVRDILFAYSISDSSGKEIWSSIGNSEKYLGILVPYGIYQESVMISNDDSHELKIILTGRDSFNFEEFFISKSNFSLNSQSMEEEKTVLIPSWVKNNAGWWSYGIIGDKEFI